MTFKEYWPEYFELKRREVKPSTLGAYLQQWKAHIASAFGDEDIEELSRSKSRMQAFVDSYAGRLSPKTVKDITIVIKNMIRVYYENVLGSAVMPTMKLKFPESEKQELEVYTKEEQKKLIAWVKENPSNLAFGIIIALATGMRIGEICALRWQDVDLDRGIIHVRGTLERVLDIERGTGTKLLMSSPKSRSSRRDIPILPSVLKTMKAYAKISRPDYFVLSGAPKPAEPRTFRNSVNEMMAKAGVRRLKFHGLRHSFATSMIAAGADLKTTSAILGHSSVEITMDVYVHPSQEDKRKMLGKTFKGIL